MPGSSALPVLPLFPDNTLPPLVLLRQWLRGAAEQGDAVGCEKLPHGNGVLPELLALASFKTLCIFRDDLPRRFIWSSPNGDSITVDNRAIEGEVSGDLPQLQGHLPPVLAAKRRRVSSTAFCVGSKWRASQMSMLHWGQIWALTGGRRWRR